MKRVNEKDYQLIRTLTDSNVKVGVIKEVSGRGLFVIKMVKESDGTFEGYRKDVNDYYLKFKKEKMMGKVSNEINPVEVQEVSDRVSNPILNQSAEMINDLKVMNLRLEHIEKMMGEHIESHQAELTLLRSKKIIW